MAVERRPDFPADALEVGRIVDAWGLKGWIRVQPYSDAPEALLAARCWYLKAPEGLNRPAVAGPTSLPASLGIREVRAQGEGLVAAASEVADRTAAEALRGARIFVGRSSFPATDADEFYWADLIGLAVVNREGEALGVVAGLIETGAQSVLRVRPYAEAAAERLIPFVAAYVDSVDLAARRIVVDWGLDF